MGPGNAYVVEAKRRLFGKVGIDLVAGPTEILVVADETADPVIVAADLLGQAEHGPASPAVLVTTSQAVAEETLRQIAVQLETLSTAEIAAQAWEGYGEVVVVDSDDEALAAADAYGFEHVEIHTTDPRWYLERMTNYGALFLGEATTVAYGDKTIGTNHILPTGGAARYTGGLWVGKFLKTVTFQECDDAASAMIGEICARQCRIENFEGHARSCDVRVEKYRDCGRPGERDRMTYRLGVDVGGTFTDVVLYDSADQRVWLAKTPSTPQDQSVGVIEGIRLAATRADVGLPEFDAILHGTTVATNAVLERRGALVGLIVTRGFRHILHLAEAWTPGPLFGFMVYEKPEPLTDTRYVREVPERTGADGSIVEPIDEAAVREAVEELVADGVEALTVCLLNAHANGRHERVIAEIAASVAPDLPVSISSEILPEFREYERTVTTLMNAYVAPALEKYLTNVRDGLAAAKVRAPLQVVRSDGGLMSLESACKNAVQTVLSGPAGGVSGASFVAGHAGFDRILTFDMGGTSTDVAVCVSGRPEITRETKVGDFPVRAPAVDVASIGAGGGSIAYVVEATGALRVGPESAGAVPGPACYGRGGTAATVTDANVVLGHLPPRLLGGEFELDTDAAYEAVARVAEVRGAGVEETARAIVSMVDEAMLGALRVVTVQRGRVPSDFALVAFGGAGGLHANALARILNCYPVIVPEESGVLSALGFIASEIKNEFSQTFVKSIAATTPDAVRKPFDVLTARARDWLDSESVDVADQDVRFILDMRYSRQGYEIPIELDGAELAALELAALERRFGEQHTRLYGFVLEGGAEIVNLRVIATGRVPLPELEARPEGGPDASEAQTGTHEVWTPEGTIDVPTYARAALEPGMTIEGYAIVEQYDATTVVLPGHRAVVDPWMNLLIRPEEASA